MGVPSGVWWKLKLEDMGVADAIVADNAGHIVDNYGYFATQEIAAKYGTVYILPHDKLWDEKGKPFPYNGLLLKKEE